MKLTVLCIAVNAITDKKERNLLNHTFAVERSELSDEFTERTNRQIDDIYYNVNELQRLSNQGVDVSNFKVANGIQSDKKRFGKKSSLLWTRDIKTKSLS